MAVYREVSIPWGGETYTFTPSNSLMRRIEGEVSLTDLAVRAQEGAPPASHIAYVAAEVMRAAGVDVSEDEMVAQLIHGDADAVSEFIEKLLGALMPQAPDAKKLAGRLVKPPRRKVKK